jgi:hypothetical protein
MPEPPVTRTDVEALVEARRELGPDHERELVDSFLERVERRIEQQAGEKRPASRPRVSPAIPITSLIVGGVVSAEAIESSASTAWVAAPMWVAIFLINLAYARRGE